MRDSFTVNFVTQKAGGHVLINEVVTDPSAIGMIRAAATPIYSTRSSALGSITTSDEWVELYNGGPLSVDLAGWTLAMNDGSNQSHGIGTSAYVTERFSSPTSSLHRFEPGTYLVVGNPVGDMLNEVTLSLQNGSGLEIDQVQLGGGAGPSGYTTEQPTRRSPEFSTFRYRCGR